MELLIDLYKISSPSRKEKNMIRYITQKLDVMCIPYEVDKHGNIYATKGRADTYPCLVAHTDEVHAKRSKGYEVVNFRDEIIFGYDTHKKRPVGIGADDKNGIWICLKCMEEFEHMKCAFFMGEEIGCIGSNRANMAFFDDCRYVLQCDRKGNRDFITSISDMDLCSDDFLNDINISDHGYRVQHGLQTDVAILKQRGLEVSCVNISCGYYNPHENEEYTNIADLNKCHQFVRHIVDTCTDTYGHVYKPLRRGRSARYAHCFYGFGNEELSHSFDHIRNRNSYKRNYPVLVNLLTERLSNDSNISIEEIMEIYKEWFPELSYQDYENAYREVVG